MEKLHCYGQGSDLLGKTRAGRTCWSTVSNRDGGGCGKAPGVHPGVTVGWKRGFAILVKVVTFLGKKGRAAEVTATERKK